MPDLAWTAGRSDEASGQERRVPWGRILGKARRWWNTVAFGPVDELLRRTIRNGTLEVIDAEGTRHRYGGSPGPAVAIRLHTPRLYGPLAVTPELTGGEAYTRGELTIEHGTVYDLVELHARNHAHREQQPFQQLRMALLKARSRFEGPTSPTRARLDVARHYDGAEEFFRLFLDEDMQYSCAYFRHESDDLEQAQRNKRQLVASKLLLERGQQVLDIGSGWGGMALHLATHHDVRVLGVTLSEEQLRVSRRRAKEARLEGRVRFELLDYREVRGTYDRVLSVGMFEHVGAADAPAFFARVRDLLTEDGVALVHAIGRRDPPRPQAPWLGKHVFPGSRIAALSEVFAEVEQSGLWCTDLELLRLHYAATLLHWRRRFAANRSRAVELYGEPFCRMWELYLAGSEAAFRELGKLVFQIQLARRIDAVPVVRDYQQEAWRSRPARHAASATTGRLEAGRERCRTRDARAGARSSSTRGARSFHPIYPALRPSERRNGPAAGLGGGRGA